MTENDSLTELERSWRADPEGALEAARAIVRESGDDRIRRGRGNLVACSALLALGRYDDAVHQILDAWDDHPTLFPHFNDRLAAVYSDVGLLDAALDCLDAAARSLDGIPAEDREVTSYLIWTNRAAMLRRHGRLAEASAAFDALLEAPPPPGRRAHVRCLLNAASCFHQVGRADEALQLLAQAESLDQRLQPRQYTDWNLALRAWTRLALGEPERAIQDAEAALSVAGRDLAARHSATRARALARARRGPEGLAQGIAELRELADKLEEKGPSALLAEVLEELGALHEQASDPAQASHTLRRALTHVQRLHATAYERRRTAEMARLRRIRHEVETTELRTRNRQLAGVSARLAMQMEDHERAFRQLVHDLRNPLTVVLAWVSQLQESGTAERDALDSIDLQVERMLQLMTEGLSKRGVGEARLEEVDVAALVRTVVDAYRPRAHSKQLELDLETPDDLLGVVDATWVGRIVDNLVSNALKFSAPQGRVEVSLTRAHDHVVLTVQDRGPGIAAEDLARVFDDGYVGVTRPTEGESSTGHGLAIVRTLAEALGGSAAARNRDDGPGAHLRVSWPLHQ